MKKDGSRLLTNYEINMRRFFCVLALVILLMLGLWLAWLPLAGFAVRYALQSSVQKVFGAELQIASIQKQNDLWVVQEPRLIHPKGWQAAVPELSVDCSLHLLNGIIDLQIAIPQLDFSFYPIEDQEGSKAFRLSTRKESRFDLFQIQSHIQITEGRILLDEEHPLLFQLLADTGSGHGEGTLWFGGNSENSENTEISESSANLMHLVFDKVPSDYHVQLHCNQVDCFPLGQLLEKIFPRSPGTLQEGTLNGVLDLTAMTGNGTLHVENAILFQNKNGVVWHLPEVEFGFHTPTTGYCSLVQSASCFLEEIPEKILGSLSEANFEFSLTDTLPVISLHAEGKAISPELFSEVWGFPTGGLFVDHPLVFDAYFTPDNHLEGRVQLIDPATEHREYLDIAMTFFLPESTVKNRSEQGWKRLLALWNGSFQKGSFARSQLPLAPWAPLFLGEESALQGVVDIEGDFNATRVTVNYSSPWIFFENEIASFEIDDDRIVGALLSGTHTFDLIAKAHEGRLRVEQASYQEKQSGLCFNDLSAEFVLVPAGISTSDLTGFCNDCFLGGRIEIEMLDFSTIAVDLYADTFDGSLKQFQPIWVAFGLPDLFNNSLEGRLSTRHGGMHLHADLTPKGTDLQVTWEGTLSEGTLLLPSADLAIDGLACRFDYDSRASALDFWDIHGKLKLSLHHAEEYALGGDHIRFTDLDEYRGEFDVWIADPSRDLVRLVGHTRIFPFESVPEPGPEPRFRASNLIHGDRRFIEVVIDPELSHVGELYPQNVELVLQGWSDIAHAKLALNHSLASWIRTLQRFSSTGLGRFSRHFLKEVKSLEEISGEIAAELEFTAEDALLTYQLTGKGIAFNKHAYPDCLLKGQMKDATWTIDELLWDGLSGTAAFHRHGEAWRVHFLGLRWGSSLLGIEGDFYPEAQRFTGKIPLCEIDLSALPSMLAHLTLPSSIKGVFHGSGELTLEGRTNRSGCKTALDLHGKLRELQLGSIRCCDSSAFNLSWHSDSGLVLRDFSTSSSDAKCTLSKAEYHIATKELALSGAYLSIPREKWHRVEEAIKPYLPASLVEAMQYPLESFQGKTLEASIDYLASPNHYLCHAVLPAGIYRVKEMNSTLRSLTIDCDPMEMAVIAVLGDQVPVGKATLKTQFPHFKRGELLFEEPEPPLEGKDPPLALRWQSDAAGQWHLQEILGSCCGISAQFRGDREKALKGVASIDFNKADPLLHALFGISASHWGISGKYEMTSRMEVDSTHVALQDLRVENQGSKLQAEQVNIGYPWQVTIPAVVVEDFRPQVLLPQLGTEHPFVIRRLELRDLHGDLRDSASWRGQGIAYCANPPKRDTSTMLWTFSDELLNKAGVGKMLLSPVSGQVEFVVQNRCLFFTAFKEMYSAGHASKFSLPKGGQMPFYLDFDGNLFVQLRMKQKNPLLRSVAPLTITIQGSLEKPTYSIRLDDKEEAA